LFAVLSMLGLCGLAGLLLAGVRVMPGALAAGSPERPAPTAPGASLAPGGSDAASESAAPAATDAVQLDRGGAAVAPDWASVLATVDEGRRAALAVGSAVALRDWVDPQGSAWPPDAALAARVVALHAQIEGGALVALEIHAQAVTPSQAVLLVRDRREPYTVVTDSGRTAVDERGPRWWRVTLARSTSAPGETAASLVVRWRIRDVAAVPDTLSPAPTGASAPATTG
jgi:hypothetical protein